MIDAIRRVLLWVHIGFGTIGLIAFWFPIFAKKGGRLHRRAGRVFEVSVYWVAGTAMIATVLIVIGAVAEGGTPTTAPNDFGFGIFLFYIALAVLATTRHGVRVQQTRRDPSTYAGPAIRALAWATIAASAAVIVYALTFRSTLSLIFLALAPVGIGAGRTILRYAASPPTHHRQWFYEHMQAMIGAGVGFHTAFAVFGSSRLLDVIPSGSWGIVPWILPVAIGVPASALWERHYRRRFGDVAGAEGAAAESPSRG